MPVDPALVAETRRYWPWLALLPLVSVWAFLVDGIYFDSLRTWVLRNAMLAGALLYVAGLLVFGPLLGNHGLWLSLALLMMARAVGGVIAWPRLARDVANGRGGRLGRRA
ncbi:MAG TPA: hypothetical protein PLT07_12780 [Trueperaceae bacterium]|nr:hypothetical protein [Trueperaceae bacterium]